jgi:hypothetical protein
LRRDNQSLASSSNGLRNKSPHRGRFVPIREVLSQRVEPNKNFVIILEPLHEPLLLPNKRIAGNLNHFLSTAALNANLPTHHVSSSV